MASGVSDSSAPNARKDNSHPSSVAGANYVNRVTRLSLKHAIKIDVPARVPVESVTVPISFQVGPEVIHSVSKANGYVKLYLTDLKAIDFICATGFDLNGERIFPEPLVKPATKLVLSNVEPFIPDSVLLHELSRFGKPIVDSMKTINASIKHESLRHVLSHRRQVFVVLKPEYSDIDGMINIKYNEHNYRVYVSSSVMRCFRCGSISHLIAGCPQPELPRINDKDFPALGNNNAKQKEDSGPKTNNETEKSESRPEKRGLPADSPPENGEPSTSSRKKPREEQITIDENEHQNEPRTEPTTNGENEHSEQQNEPRQEPMTNGENEQNEPRDEPMTNGENEQNEPRDETMTNGENKQTTNDNEKQIDQTNEQSEQNRQTNDKDEQINAIQTVDRTTDEAIPQHSDERVLSPPSSNTLLPNNAVSNLFRLDDLPSLERMTDWSPGLVSEDDTNMETLSQVSEACDLEELSEPTEEQDNETRYTINLGIKKRKIELIPEKEIEKFLENIKTRKNHLKLCVQFCSDYKKLYFSLQKYRLESAVSDKNLNQRLVRLCEKIAKVCKVKKIDLEK